jgi:hypothetical protein
LASHGFPQLGFSCGQKVKHETGFKTFLNALDYSAVFLMAYQDPPHIEHQTVRIEAAPKPMRIRNA